MKPFSVYLDLYGKLYDKILTNHILFYFVMIFRLFAKFIPRNLIRMKYQNVKSVFYHHSFGNPLKFDKSISLKITQLTKNWFVPIDLACHHALKSHMWQKLLNHWTGCAYRKSMKHEKPVTNIRKNVASDEPENNRCRLIFTVNSPVFTLSALLFYHVVITLYLTGFFLLLLFFVLLFFFDFYLWWLSCSSYF